MSVIYIMTKIVYIDVNRLWLSNFLCDGDMGGKGISIEGRGFGLWKDWRWFVEKHKKNRNPINEMKFKKTKQRKIEINKKYTVWRNGHVYINNDGLWWYMGFFNGSPLVWICRHRRRRGGDRRPDWLATNGRWPYPIHLDS